MHRWLTFSVFSDDLPLPTMSQRNDSCVKWLPQAGVWSLRSGPDNSSTHRVLSRWGLLCGLAFRCAERMLSPDLEIKAIKLIITLEVEKKPNTRKVGLNLMFQSREWSEKCHIIVPMDLEVRHSPWNVGMTVDMALMLGRAGCSWHISEKCKHKKHFVVC